MFKHLDWQSGSCIPIMCFKELYSFTLNFCSNAPLHDTFFSLFLRKKPEERNRWEEQIWKPLGAEFWTWLFSCFLVISRVTLYIFWTWTSSLNVILIICRLNTQSNIWTGFERETERLPLSLSSCERVAGQSRWEHRRDPSGSTDSIHSAVDAQYEPLLNRKQTAQFKLLSCGSMSIWHSSRLSTLSVSVILLIPVTDRCFRFSGVTVWQLWLSCCGSSCCFLWPASLLFWFPDFMYQSSICGWCFLALWNLNVATQL